MKSPDWKKLVDKEMAAIAPLFQSYPWEDKAAYVDFISNMYYFLAQACRLLTAAASRCDTDSMDKFYHRFVEHASEEKNHEKLVLTDLKNLKVPLQGHLASMPAVWQTQFFLIEKKNPLALFGCVLYLESLSVYHETAPQGFERSRKIFGDKCTNYLRVHILEDGDHVNKLFNMMKILPEDSFPVVEESFRTTASLYMNFFRELHSKHHSKALSEAS